MQYLILIHTEEGAWATMTPAQQGEGMKAYMAYTQSLRAKDKLVESGRLQPSTATRQITIRDGQRRIADGPFADTKEQLGGFYLVNAANEAEAIELAALCPGAHHGRIELRPLAAM